MRDLCSRLSLVFVLSGVASCAVYAAPVSADEHPGAQLMPAIAAEMDNRMTEVSEAPSDTRIADADLRHDALTFGTMQEDFRDQLDMDLSYRPLCGPRQNAINHVYCAPGYDVW